MRLYIHMLRPSHSAAPLTTGGSTIHPISSNLQAIFIIFFSKLFGRRSSRPFADALDPWRENLFLLRLYFINLHPTLILGIDETVIKMLI